MKATTLLTKGESSPKLVKYTGDKYMSAILYLASASYAPQLCPNAGACVKSCLITKAGRGAFDDKVSACRKRRSDWLLSDRPAFVAQLVGEIGKAEVKAKKNGKVLAVRLNGGSDLDWTDVYSRFPGVQFWEYTKRPELALKISRQFSNVHVVYSFSERTTLRILTAMAENSIQVVKVFNVKRGQPLPVGVVDGDLHDFRWLDPRGAIIGLRLKSNKRVTSEQTSGGFVQNNVA